jgi:hypothetical protein
MVGCIGSIYLRRLMSISSAVCCGLLTVFGVGSITSETLAAPENLLLAQSPTSAVNLASAFNGSNPILLRDLTSEWRCMNISGSGELGFTTLLLYGSGGFPTPSYYTKGQTILIGSDSYLMAYSLSSVTDKITADTPLALSLISLKSIGNFNNIRPFSIEKETILLEKQLKFLKRANGIDDSSALDAPRAESKPAARKPIKKGRQ